MPQPHRGNEPFLEFQIFRSWVIFRLLHLQVEFPSASHTAAHVLPYYSGFWVSAALPLHCQEGNITDLCTGCSAFPNTGEPSVVAGPTTKHHVDGLLRYRITTMATLSPPFSQESWWWAQKGILWHRCPTPPFLTPISIPHALPHCAPARGGAASSSSTASTIWS